MTAIVGKSGAGKSTLIDMLIGMVKPEIGEVRVDGRLLNGAEVKFGSGNRFAFRQTISYVSQEPFLFHATLRENLLVAAPDATEAHMWEALQFAASEDFVRRLPQGLDTELGDRGIRLSGGERQRIVLARAILRKPSVLILDEATSALDSENEAHIQAALEKLKGSMTIIVIAHRLSTIRHADQVLVMEQGRLIRQGGYQQLAAESDGVFGKLLSYQQAGYTAASSFNR
jgi:ATP-binding cassette subfamily C protein